MNVPSELPTVTVITPTTGGKHLERAIEGVNNQTYKNIQHLIVVDGEHRIKDAEKIFDKVPPKNGDIIYLPYSVGSDGWNGHRVYGSMPYLAKGEWITYLDDDNWYEPNHIETCLNNVSKNKTGWTFSLRKIVDKDGNYICNDDCESLGKWPSILGDNDYFVDTSCYFMHRNLAISISSVWYRKFRQQGMVEVDRAVCQALRHITQNSYTGTSKYTVNYAVGNTPQSVVGEFFIQGNKKMLQKHNGKLPWKDEYIIL
ncbi:MAG: glycosyltransferase family 2 protein [Proteobacteria bacterium]|nr:glycosyltransferase family 2 protein [Pseudomonadota bacterium]NBP14478.1 glycosyltransferase family 2 protein [bacterium]